MKPLGQFRGFTLLELLIVLALIGVLASLLIPAVQNAREAGRRAICQNNLKQIGIALLNYENSRSVLPVGSKSNGMTHGISWQLASASYLEELPLLDEFDIEGPHSGWVLMHPENGRIVDGVVIPPFICPSAMFPNLVRIGGFWLMTPSYVGIAGAVGADDFQESRTNACCIPSNDGVISAGGLLITNRSVSLKEVRDGSSKTIAVGEASDYVLRGATPFRIDSGFPNGWTMGTMGAGTPPNYAVPLPAWGITTVRYPINTRRYDLPGIDQDRGPNNPLVAPHPGGINSLFVGGGVDFLSQDIELLVLKRLASRDDLSLSSR
jgi:prepilin-type N-terminal cleavage/methylation domain-containing protein